MRINLYKRDVKGVMRAWSIRAEGSTVFISHGIYGGIMQVKTEVVAKGLGGRSLDQQVASRVQSRINLQKDKGYVEDFNFALMHQATNTLGFPLPMLAQRYDKVKASDEYYAQRKYDGNRCLITKQGGTLRAYTRKGKENFNLEHILEAAAGIPEGLILDGELYAHGVPLQTIRSWVARKQAATKNLKYMCYDIMSPAGYAERLTTLRFLPLAHPIDLAETWHLSGSEASPEALSARLAEVLVDGYEGLILRSPTGGYEAGKRSKTLVKLKPGHIGRIKMESEEFEIVDIHAARDGWAILECKCAHGTFRVSAPGTMEEKFKVYDDRSYHMGRYVTVDFSGYTLDGIPFQPVATAFREAHD